MLYIFLLQKTLRVNRLVNKQAGIFVGNVIIPVVYMHYQIGHIAGGARQR